jgi:hypothetical protein
MSKYLKHEVVSASYRSMKLVRKSLKHLTTNSRTLKYTTKFLKPKVSGAKCFTRSRQSMKFVCILSSIR